VKLFLPCFAYRPVPQHQMGKIEIEGMRRHVGALGHEAHVAQRAGFHDAREIFRLHAFHFVWAGVDQIEQTRKGITQIETAPAAVTDVEDAAQLGVEFCGVGEIFRAPIDRMACRGVQTSFAGHGLPRE